MPPLTRIICLANSRKHGGRCIAGIETSSGAWVRPVSDLDDGRVERKERLIDGLEPALGEVLELPLAEEGPNFDFESENRSILYGPWRRVGTVPVDEIFSFRSSDPIVLHNDENFVMVQYLQTLPFAERRTLQLVAVSDFTAFSAGFSPNGGRKWRGAFTAGSGARLAGMITDPILVEKLENGYRPSPRALLTMSLSMPYRPEEWSSKEVPCWKLIAAYIPLETGDRARYESRDCLDLTRPVVFDPPVIDTEGMKKAMESIFGFRCFRPGQEEIVRAILAGRDVFAVMPTGGGKSFCFQLPACLLPGACLVISPLIALMKDQVDAARGNGIRAAYLNSSQSEPERVAVLRDLTEGKLDLLYVSPERFALEQFVNSLKRSPLCLAAIDEAHCICEWGHDFRPDYLLLSQIAVKLPAIPVAAFTASATEAMQNDIIGRLGLRNPFLHRGSFNRPNLFYGVKTKENGKEQMVEFIRRHPGEAGIVYRATRSSVESTSALLVEQGIKALPYHAGLDDATRTRNQEAFHRDEADVMVATIAFGMGIDKPNIRYVLHGDLPRSLENYHQETGRAGRDGEPAHCLLLFSRSDIPKIRYFLDQIEDPEIRRRHLRALNEMVAYAEIDSCRRKSLIAHFGETLPEETCGHCDICAQGTDTIDVTLETQMILTAILRTGERFGAGYIIDILRGANTRQIRSFGHDKLKTYGVGRTKSKPQWQKIMDTLLHQGVLLQTDGQYPVLHITAEGRQALSGRRAVQMAQVRSEAARPEMRPKAGYDEALFERLRWLRQSLAGEKGVPPFVIFSDRTLREMASVFPSTDRRLLMVTGVGEAKLFQYGSAFIREITAYVRDNPEARERYLKRPEDAEQDVPHKFSTPAGPSGTVEETYRLLNQGLTIQEAASHRGLTSGTIVAHIERLLAAGRELDIDRFIAPERRKEIEALFTKLRTDALKPVVVESNNTISYDEARLARAWMKRKISNDEG